MPNVEPPDWVVKKLAALYPRGRLGNAGHPTNYALCELWRVREESMIGADFEGKLFGKDYDRLGFKPRYIVDIPVQDVFSGKVLDTTKHMLSDFKARQLKVLQEAGKKEDDEIKEIAEEQGKELFKTAMRSYHRPEVLAKKFISKEDRAIASGEAGAQIDIANSYVNALPTDGVSIK